MSEAHGGADVVAVSRNSCNSLPRAFPQVATVTTAPPPTKAETVPAPAIEWEYNALASTCLNAVSIPVGCSNLSIPVESVQDQGIVTWVIVKEPKGPRPD